MTDQGEVSEVVDFWTSLGCSGVSLVMMAQMAAKSYLFENDGRSAQGYEILIR